MPNIYDTAFRGLPPLQTVQEGLTKRYMAQEKCIAVLKQRGMEESKYWMDMSDEQVFRYPTQSVLSCHSLVRTYLGETFDALIAGQILLELSKAQVLSSHDFHRENWRSILPALRSASTIVFGQIVPEPFLKCLLAAWHKKAKEVKRAIVEKEVGSLDDMIALHHLHEQIGTHMAPDLRATLLATLDDDDGLEEEAFRRTLNPDPISLAQLKAHEMTISETRPGDDQYEDEDDEEQEMDEATDEEAELSGDWLQQEAFLQQHQHWTAAHFATALGLESAHIPGMASTRRGSPFELTWVQWLALWWLDQHGSNAPYLALDPGLGKTAYCIPPSQGQYRRRHYYLPIHTDRRAQGRAGIRPGTGRGSRGTAVRRVHHPRVLFDSAHKGCRLNVLFLRGLCGRGA
jgi:hypothetical protein